MCFFLDMANIVLLLVIIMLVFSVIGVTLFKDTVPSHFGALSSGIFSIFDISYECHHNCNVPKKA